RAVTLAEEQNQGHRYSHDRRQNENEKANRHQRLPPAVAQTRSNAREKPGAFGPRRHQSIHRGRRDPIFGMMDETQDSSRHEKDQAEGHSQSQNSADLDFHRDHRSPSRNMWAATAIRTSTKNRRNAWTGSRGRARDPKNDPVSTPIATGAAMKVW